MLRSSVRTFGRQILPNNMQLPLKYADWTFCTYNSFDPHFFFEECCTWGRFKCRYFAESKYNHPCISSMNQVSSRGCSRAYILCVLYRGLRYVRNLRAKSQPVSFPFPAFEIECWLDNAKEDCSDVAFQRMYGGTDFSPSDVSTFWTSASHFYTW